MPVRNEAEKTGEKKAPAAKAKAPEVVKVHPLETRVIKFLEDVEKGLSKRVNEKMLRQVADANGGKVPVLFVSFSPNGEADDGIDDEFNVATIKEVLFSYHSAKDKAPTGGKELVLEVLAPEEGTDDPYALVFQEI